MNPGGPATARSTVDRAIAGLRSNPSVVDAAAAPVFSPAECDAIVAACAADGWRDLAAPTAQSAARQKTEQTLPSGNGGWIANRIARKVTELNDEVFGFRLLGLEDPVRVFRYRAQEAGEFRAHIDLSPVQPLRKLTFSVLLSDPADFEGGELSFATGAFPHARARGTITLFPSFVLHQVTPVIAGQRFVIVGWALGPTFV